MKIKIGILILTVILTLYVYSYFYSGDKILVACIGDSNTEGHGLFPKSIFSYPSLLQFNLGSNYKVNNYGKAGSCVSANKNRYKDSLIYKISKNINHKHYILIFGTNDSKNLQSDFYDKYKSLIFDYNFASPEDVIICTPPPAYSTNWGINDSIISNSICMDILKIADECGFKVVDLNKILKSRKYFEDDGIHLNYKGAKLTAQSISKIIKNSY
jgi:lysophospholipase L1-like esterase